MFEVGDRVRVDDTEEVLACLGDEGQVVWVGVVIAEVKLDDGEIRGFYHDQLSKLERCSPARTSVNSRVKAWKERGGAL